MTTAEFIEDGQVAGPALGDIATPLLATLEVALGLAGAEPGWDSEDGVDAFALSKRLRYLDAMAGFDGGRAVRR